MIWNPFLKRHLNWAKTIVSLGPLYIYSYPNRWKWPKKQSAYIPNLLLFQDFNHQLQGIWKFSRVFLKQNFYLVGSEKSPFLKIFFAQRVWIQTIYHWLKLVNSLSKLDIWGVSTMHQKWEKKATINCWISVGKTIKLHPSKKVPT